LFSNIRIRHNGKVNSITPKVNHQKRGKVTNRPIFIRRKYTTKTSSSVNAIIRTSELTIDTMQVSNALFNVLCPN